MSKVDLYGMWTFESETLLVRVDDATYQRHLKAHLQRLGIDTRTCSQLLDYVNEVLTRRIEASKDLDNPDYWLHCDDPHVHVLRKLPEDDH